jgi:hypothetical protein
MNNYYIMAITVDEKRRKREAGFITAGFLAFLLLAMLLVKWKIPLFAETLPEPGIEIEFTLPEEPETLADGGGGGGNPVQAKGEPGVAKYTPPPPGEPEPSKVAAVDADNDDKEAPALPKHAVVKPEAKKTVTTSVVKTTPKPVEETPAPRTPKNVMGKTTTGVGKGGGVADDFERSGGRGNGSGVGNGNGTGGGTGNGFGGGNGTGGGTGNGPKVTRGDRKIVRYYSFDGDLDKAVIYANISVSPEGVGRFISIAKGSSNSSNAYKEAVIRYLQNIKFDKADHESMLTVQFNFKVN